MLLFNKLLNVISLIPYGDGYAKEMLRGCRFILLLLLEVDKPHLAANHFVCKPVLVQEYKKKFLAVRFTLVRHQEQGIVFFGKYLRKRA